MFALKYFNRSQQTWLTSNYSINPNADETVAGMVDFYQRNGGNSAVYGLVVSDEPGAAMVHVPTGVFPDLDTIRTYDGGAFAPALNDLLTLEAYLEATRPQPPTTPAVAPVSTPAESTEAPMVTLDIKRGTVDGKNHGSALMLIIDAKPLHDLLDLMGCEVSGDTYRNGPSFGGRVVDSADNLAPGIFLRRVYPYKVNLSEVYSTPPTLSRLRHLAESANSAVQRILEHYRPIDIKVTIAKQPAA